MLKVLVIVAAVFLVVWVLFWILAHAGIVLLGLCGLGAWALLQSRNPGHREKS
jgi:hypothetical protein